MTRTRMLGSAVLAAALATTLTACGSSEADEFADQSVKQIKADVQKDMGSLKSMTIDGSFNNDGKKTSLKLSADTDGNCVGTLGQDGAEADIISVGGASYIKADEAFWKAQAGPSAEQIISLLDGKWAKLPSSAGTFSEFCDLDSFLDEINQDDDAGTVVTKGDLEEIGGKQALEIKSKADDGTTHGWVAAEGKHYFLRMEMGGKDKGSFDFSDFNKAVDAKAPSEDNVFDMSSMG
ncbi:MAG TPA: hypothetical protein VFO98_00125 [Marmoricola sp.]|jgi:hypothetical protein|nr:hypothetical protein [Marmoricola sp.]